MHAQTQRLTERESGKRVRGVVQAFDLHGRQSQQWLALAREPPLAISHLRVRWPPQVVIGDLTGVVGADRGAKREPEGLLPRPRHGDDERIIEVDHRRLAALENASLGGRVFLDRGVAVEMIRRHVQNGGRFEGERRSRLELKAGELEHVELSWLLPCTGSCRRSERASPWGARRGLQQVQRRLTQVSAHAHPQPGALGHPANERRHGALSVGPGDPHHRRISRAREQLDVANDFDTAAPGFDKKRLAQRYPGRGDHQVRALQQPGIQPANPHRDPGIDLFQARELRRALPRIRNRQPPAARVQVARTGEPRATQSHDHSVTRLGGSQGHRSFNVASPASTNSSEMIQNRTITFGSGQPLSSKW